MSTARFRSLSLIASDRWRDQGGLAVATLGGLLSDFEFGTGVSEMVGKGFAGSTEIDGTDRTSVPVLSAVTEGGTRKDITPIVQLSKRSGTIEFRDAR